MPHKKHLSFTAMRQALSKIIRHYPDSRSEAYQIPLHDIVMSAIACMFYQDASLLAFQKRLEERWALSNLHTQFGVSRVPENTQMRLILDQLDTEHYRPLFRHLMTQIQRAKLLKPFESPLTGYLCSLDGTQYYWSTKIRCQHCLTAHKKTGTLYRHQMVQAVLVHPNQRIVFPFMPTEVSNRNPSPQGTQDSERQAAKRLIHQLKHTHPRLKLTLLGNALYAEQPFIQQVLDLGYHFIFSSKPSRQVFLHEEASLITTKRFSLVIQEGQYRHTYIWAHRLPLKAKSSVKVNFLDYTMARLETHDTYRTVYHNSWITDHLIHQQNVVELVRSARCRWKVENECFNNLKNQGYKLEHNFGHGENHLAFAMVCFMMLAFFMHQILTASSQLFQKVYKKHGSKRYLWESLRSFIRVIIFDTFESLLEYAFEPDAYESLQLNRSPLKV